MTQAIVCVYIAHGIANSACGYYPPIEASVHMITYTQAIQVAYNSKSWLYCMFVDINLMHIAIQKKRSLGACMGASPASESLTIP